MTNNIPAKAVVGDHEIEGDVANVTSLDDTTKQGGFDKADGGRNLNKGPSDTKEPVDSLNTDFTCCHYATSFILMYSLASFLLAVNSNCSASASVA